ncbi:D12 class N6 adenine-specific DNA methyltransferase family protein [Synechococcus sp. A15-44]|nr:D12 class N6 adenine-specific DNA methyltransferase family protein [Synechococcus sp. A15-44]
MLSTKAGKEIYVVPIVAGDTYGFEVRSGAPGGVENARKGTKSSRANFCCLLSGAPITGDYLKEEGNSGRMGAWMMAVAAAGKRGRVYMAPSPDDEDIARKANPAWKPDVIISGTTQYLGVKPYGMESFGDLFTDRQLEALNTFADLVQEVREHVKADSAKAGRAKNESALCDSTWIGSYADAVATGLAFAISRSVDRGSTSCSWDSCPKMEALRNIFGRQAIPMTWDFAEGNPFSESSGNWMNNIEWGAKSIRMLPARKKGFSCQDDASRQKISMGKIVSTDPPYYDNIPYADLSDFFYVWLRRSLKSVYPELFATLAVPKAEELVAFAYRHDGKSGAEDFFLNGMTNAMQ